MGKEGLHIPLVLKFEDWPSQDRKAWEALSAAGSYFDAGGPCAHWSEGTRGLRRQAYGQWLSFVLRTCPELTSSAPTKRITRDRAEAFIDESKARLKLRSVSNLIISLASLGQAMDPEADWDWLWRAGTRLYQQSDPYALKPRIPLTASDLFRWALNRIAQVEDDPDLHPLTRAMQFRQALTVGLLITRPVRARAFINLELQRHLHVSPDGYRLRFYPEDMKDRRARSYALPRQLVTPMRRYLSVYRPVLLCGTESKAVWISQRGNRLSQDSFTSGLALLTRRHFGLALRPHTFRHIAATSIAEIDPCHVGIIRDILGHATLDMAERHYNRAGAVTAAMRMQSMLRDIRREGITVARANRRRREHW